MLLLSHGLDLYDSRGLGAKWDQVFRLFMVLGLVAFALAAVDFLYGHFLPGRVFLPGLQWGLVVLAVMLLVWRGAYSWIVQQSYFRERVYVLGTGDRAERLLNGLRQRSELGIEVVGWTGNIEGELTRETRGIAPGGLAQGERSAPGDCGHAGPARHASRGRIAATAAGGREGGRSDIVAGKNLPAESKSSS